MKCWQEGSRALPVAQLSGVVKAEWSTGEVRDSQYVAEELALLCHKEPAQGTQSPLIGAFLAFRWFFTA